MLKAKAFLDKVYLDVGIPRQGKRARCAVDDAGGPKAAITVDGRGDTHYGHLFLILQ
jgi:hypothetical protein